jgi:predicted amidophosphoribosyltransferase
VYLREYTPRAGHAYSETNQLILNFKKTVDRKDRPEYYYKEQAIERFTREVAASIKKKWWETATLIPIPPSKSKDNPVYDDRMTQVLNGIGAYHDITCDVRELLVQTSDMDAVHLHNNDRPTPNQLKQVYKIDENLITPTPKVIGVFDDVITAGAHFRAAKDLLEARFPGVPVIGIFIARRLPTL